MKTLFRQITSSLLLVAFVFAIAPKELIHELTGHEDAHHGIHSDPEIGEHHIHCTSLGLSLPVFAVTETHDLPFRDFQRVQYVLHVEQVFHQFLFISPDGRAPPSIA